MVIEVVAHGMVEAVAGQHGADILRNLTWKREALDKLGKAGLQVNNTNKVWQNIDRLRETVAEASDLPIGDLAPYRFDMCLLGGCMSLTYGRPVGCGPGGLEVQSLGCPADWFS